MQGINIKYHHSGCTCLHKQKGKRTSNKGVNKGKSRPKLAAQSMWSVGRSDSLSEFCREQQSIAAAKQVQAWRWGQRAQRGHWSRCHGKGAGDICRLNGGHYHDMYTIKSMLDGDDANLLLS